MEDLPGQLVNVVKTGREILDFISPANSFIYSKKTLISHLIIWYMQTGYELLQTKNLVSMYVYLVRLNSLPVLYHLESNFAFFLSIHISSLCFLHASFSSAKAGRGLDIALTCHRAVTAHADLCYWCSIDCFAKPLPPHTETPLKGERGASSLALLAWQSSTGTEGEGKARGLDKPGSTILPICCFKAHNSRVEYKCVLCGLHSPELQIMKWGNSL